VLLVLLCRQGGDVDVVWGCGSHMYTPGLLGQASGRSGAVGPDAVWRPCMSSRSAGRPLQVSGKRTSQEQDALCMLFDSMIWRAEARRWTVEHAWCVPTLIFLPTNCDGYTSD
jgi:hypothetical protein